MHHVAKALGQFSQMVCLAEIFIVEYDPAPDCGASALAVDFVQVPFLVLRPFAINLLLCHFGVKLHGGTRIFLTSSQLNFPSE